MTIKQKFIAFNGAEFKTEEECLNYEASIKKLQNSISSLKIIQDFCNEQPNCLGCVFGDTSTEECMFRKDVPEWWNLSEIDKRIGG